MKQEFSLGLEQFHAHLQRVISSLKCYRLVVENTDRHRFTIYYPSKAIVIEGTLASVKNGTELNLTATSPFCVISAEYEQRILNVLLIQLRDTLIDE
jgi:hypothetical protein